MKTKYIIILMFIVVCCICGFKLVKGEITKYTCDACYDTKYIYFNHEGTHYRLPRYNLKGDLTKDSIALKKMVNNSIAMSNPKPKIEPVQEFDKKFKEGVFTWTKR